MLYDEDLYDNIPYSIPEHEIRHMKDHMIGLIEALYTTNSPIIDIEHHLEEIAGVLDIQIPKTPLRVKREKEKVVDELIYSSYKHQRNNWLDPTDKPEHIMNEFFPDWKDLEERYQKEVSFTEFRKRQKE